MFGAISEKFRTFDMQINFAMPPNFSLSSVIGGILFHFFKVTKFLSLYQSTCCVIIKHFTTVPIVIHLDIVLLRIHQDNGSNDMSNDRCRLSISPRPPQNSHHLDPVFAVLSVLGFIDDGRLQDFDRVPGAGWDDAAVIAGRQLKKNYAPMVNRC